MMKQLAGALVCAGVLGLAGAAQAGTYEYSNESQRRNVQEAPLKDCTKFNSRYGFYGNPYCTPEEQARFDRWEARKLNR